MRYITRRSLGESIENVNGKFKIWESFLRVLFTLGIHFIVVCLLLFNVVPRMMDIEEAYSYIETFLGICFGVYPLWGLYNLNRDLWLYNQKVNQSQQIIEEVTEDMLEMGFDVEKQSLLDAEVTIISKCEAVTGKKFSDITILKSEERIIKIIDKKSELMILREVTKAVQGFSYINYKPSSIVHLLDEEEYARTLEKKNK